MNHLLAMMDILNIKCMNENVLLKLFKEKINPTVIFLYINHYVHDKV